MKKYLFTVLGTGLILLSVFLADYSINKDFAVVKTLQVQGETVNRYVTASGTICESDKRDIYVNLPFKMAKVNVKVGDRVKTGQKLAYLDKKAFLNELNLAIVKGDAPVYSSDETGTNQDLLQLKKEVEETPETVISPIDGIVTGVNCSENGRVSTEIPVIRVSNMESFYIKAKIPENKAKDIYLNQMVFIKAAGMNQEYEGIVESISPTAQTGQAAKQDTPYIEANVKLNQISDEIKPGLTAELKFLTDTKPDAIVVPFDSVLEDEDGHYVYLNRSGYAKKQYVSLGEEFETRVEIQKGVSKEDKVILHPRKNEITHGKKIDEITGESNADS